MTGGTKGKSEHPPRVHEAQDLDRLFPKELASNDYLRLDFSPLIFARFLEPFLEHPVPGDDDDPTDHLGQSHQSLSTPKLLLQGDDRVPMVFDAQSDPVGIGQTRGHRRCEPAKFLSEGSVRLPDVPGGQLHEERCLHELLFERNDEFDQTNSMDCSGRHLTGLRTHRPVEYVGQGSLVPRHVSGSHIHLRHVRVQVVPV